MICVEATMFEPVTCSCGAFRCVITRATCAFMWAAASITSASEAAPADELAAYTTPAAGELAITRNGRRDTMSEQQRVAIVTGAAGGIGRELVLGLLGKGLKIAAVDRTSQGLADLVQAAQERQQGANLITIEADLARDEAID